MRNTIMGDVIHSVLLILLLIVYSGGAQSIEDAPLSIMFTSGWDAEAINTVANGLQDEDYFGPPLQSKQKNKGIPFSLSASLDDVERKSVRSCRVSDKRELVVYDPEEWEQTPKHEQQDLSGSIARAAEIVGGNPCLKFGIAPSGPFVGRRGCKGKSNSLSRSVDWTKVDVFIIQAQGMLSARCGGLDNVNEYSKFISEWVQIVKQLNPAIKVMGHFSFRHSPPETMQSAIVEMRGKVDGFYIAYPKIEGKTCKYCTPENLNRVIKSIKEPNQVSTP